MKLPSISNHCRDVYIFCWSTICNTIIGKANKYDNLAKYLVLDLFGKLTIQMDNIKLDLTL